MDSDTGGTLLDRPTIERLRATAAIENRSPSQIRAVALKMFLEMSSGARRALFAMNEDERRFAAKELGRAVLAAYDRIIDARHRGEGGPPNTDEAIEAEAIRLCRP